jgi:hypothetical protein
MLSSFDNVVTVYKGMSQHMHTSVAITTTLIHLLITNTNNAKYIILAMQMLIHTLHQREVLGHDKKDALESQPEVITIYQLLAHGRWFSPCTPASSTTKTGRHDIAEILLKVALTTINKLNQIKPLKSHDLT